MPWARTLPLHVRVVRQAPDTSSRTGHDGATFAPHAGRETPFRRCRGDAGQHHDSRRIEETTMRNDENITLALDRESHQIRFSRLLWSSAGTPWPGFRLERHAVGPAGRLEDFAVPEVLLGLCVKGRAEL